MLKTALTRLAKGSLVYGIGGILKRFMGLLLLPFFTSELTTEDYGVVGLVSLVGIAMSGLLTLGTGNSMGLLYFKEKELEERPAIIWTNFFLIVINGSFWFIVLYLLAPALSRLMFQSELHSNLIRLSFLGSVLTAVADPLLAYLRMEEKAKEYVALTLFSSLLTIVLSIYLVLWMEIGVMGLILSVTIGSAFSLVVIALTVGRRVPFGITPKLFAPLIRIGLPSIFGLFAFLLIDYADRQMIERMIGLSKLGIYSVGYSFGMVMTIAMGAFATAWPPFFMSYVDKREQAGTIFARVLTYYVLGFGSLIVIIFFFAKPVTVLLTATAFHEAWVVVGLVAAAYALKGCYLILLPGIYIAEKLVYQSMIEWIAAIVNIGLNLWLIPLLGMLGAAIATFISYLSLPILAWFISKKYLKVDYEWSRLAFVSTLVTLTCFALYQISKYFSSEIFKIILYGSIVCSIYSAITFMLFLKIEERQFILKKIGL